MTDTDQQLANADKKNFETSASAITVKLVYFAWVRERVGKGEETLSPPSEVRTIADLMVWLGARGPEYADVFEAKKDVVRAAINQNHVPPQTSLEGAREIAFFPPVTGG